MVLLNGLCKSFGASLSIFSVVLEFVLPDVMNNVCKFVTVVDVPHPGDGWLISPSHFLHREGNFHASSFVHGNLAYCFSRFQTINRLCFVLLVSAVLCFACIWRCLGWVTNGFTYRRYSSTPPTSDCDRWDYQRLSLLVSNGAWPPRLLDVTPEKKNSWNGLRRSKLSTFQK